ncbi:MAG: DUF2141 domain-containing protein [Bacteroidetes bacterium]|nr:DUF2141 domain-containing protein [Bacteroidota bacterium]
MKYTLIFITALLLSSFRYEDNGTLIVTLSNIKKNGKIYVGLYKKGEDFPNDQYRVKNLVKDCPDSCSIQFDSIPYGEYAVAIYQDVNNNHKLDTGMFGIPSEPFAFSNNFRPKFGGPTFAKCEFNFSKNKQTIQIRMINSVFGSD